MSIVNSRALKATLGAGMISLLVGGLGLSALSASAQPTTPDPSTTTTSSSSTSTTEMPSTTTTTQASTTSTTQASTTTTQQGSTTTQRSGTSTAPRNSSSTSSTASTTTTAAPAPVTPSGYSGPSSDGGSWFSSGWKIASIIAGLIAAAGGLAFTTVLYWRQTRPGQTGTSNSGGSTGPSGLVGPVEPSLAAALRPDTTTGPIPIAEPSPGFVTRDDLGLSPS